MNIDADAPHENLPVWTPLKVLQVDGEIVRFENSRYLVSLRREERQIFGMRREPVWNLGIQNFDHSARHDWRDFQRIKNELLGPEFEAVELYPAESRRLDPSNYFILYVFRRHIPLGVCRGRFIVGPQDAAAPQRTFEPGQEPAPLGEDQRQRLEAACRVAGFDWRTGKAAEDEDA